jgi:uncharacterized MAPEG superfamily protein
MITVPMTMLLYSTILMFILIIIPAGMALHKNGPQAQGGARDELPEPSIFMKRANRLNANMRENMIMFTALVFISSMLNMHGGNIALGAQIFFYARVAHAVIYLAGWPMVRPVVWTVSVVGMGMMAFDLLTHSPMS